MGHYFVDHGVDGLCHKWSKGTKYDTTNSPPGPLTAATRFFFAKTGNKKFYVCKLIIIIESDYGQ